MALPPSSYTLIRQVLWLLSGRLDLREGKTVSSLKAGDRLEFGPPSDVHNPGDTACRYMVAVLRR